MYKYEAKSVKGIIFLITTLISIIIMGIAITGYIDLSLTEHQFRDMIEKEINGELNCIGSNKSITKNDEMIRKTRHLINLPGFTETLVMTWNCSHAAEVISKCYTDFENIKSKRQHGKGFETFSLV